MYILRPEDKHHDIGVTDVLRSGARQCQTLNEQMTKNSKCCFTRSELEMAWRAKCRGQEKQIKLIWLAFFCGTQTEGFRIVFEAFIATG